MRALTNDERRLVLHLVTAAGWVVDLETLLVEPMDDGGMGSLRFASPASARKLGAYLSDVCFTDTDGVLVSAALSVDQHGDLFELDVWKGDFSPLHRWPEVEHLFACDPSFLSSRT